MKVLGEKDQVTRPMSSQSKAKTNRGRYSSSLNDLPQAIHTFTTPLKTTTTTDPTNNNNTTTTTTTRKKKGYLSFPSGNARRGSVWTPLSSGDHRPSSFSEHSIELLKENRCEQTRIELRFPSQCEEDESLSPSSRVRPGEEQRRRRRTVREGREREREFTLPTDPPITVTIESDLHRDPFHSSSIDFAADELCSSSLMYSSSSARRRRQSFDPSLKGTSSIVNYFMDLLKPSDNKLAMKLFGSRKGLLKERLRQQRAGHCIIHPCSTFRSLFLFLSLH